MQSNERAMLAERLSALADAMGGKLPTSEKGMAMWLEAIEDLPGWAVLQSVTNWMRHSDRFPTAYTLRKAALDLIETEQERDAQKNVEETPTIDEVANRDPEKAKQFQAYLKAYRETVVHDPKMHIWWNTLLWAKGKISAFGASKVIEYYGRAPTEAEIEAARERIREANAKKLYQPVPSDFIH